MFFKSIINNFTKSEKMADQNHEQEQNPYMIAYMDYIISKKTADEVAKDLHIGRRKLIQEWNNLGLQLKKEAVKKNHTGKT